LILADLVAGVIEPELCSMELGDVAPSGDLTNFDVMQLVLFVMGF
jgi:hypothetical protein